MRTIAAHSDEVRREIREAIRHLQRVLPGQAPIKGFVHHNTLHGFQHLPFPDALVEVHRVTGNYGYLSSDRFRALYAAGRIDREDLELALADTPELEPDKSLIEGKEGLTRGDVYRVALRHPLSEVTASQLGWQIEEQEALRRFQDDVPESARQCLLAASTGSTDEPSAIADLWDACLQSLGLQHFLLHPEDLTDLSAEQAEQMFEGLDKGGSTSTQPVTHREMRREAAARLGTLLDRTGTGLTLRGVLEGTYR